VILRRVGRPDVKLTGGSAGRRDWLVARPDGSLDGPWRASVIYSYPSGLGFGELRMRVRVVMPCLKRISLWIRQCRSLHARRLRFVAMGLDPISIGIDDERGIVVRVVVGANSRRAVVAPSRFQRGCVEGINAFACWSRKTKMQS
jgi:hypothetical protein